MEGQGLESPLCQALPPEVRRAGRHLVLSHAVNMLGSKAWEFALPLVLIRASGGRLVAPAVLGMATTAAEFLLGPPVGRWADGMSSRLSTVALGSGAQAAAVFGTLLLLLLAQGVGCGGDLGLEGATPLWFGGSRPLLGGALFAGVCLCGVVEVLGRLASTVSVERDWVPTAFEPYGEAALARVNARMANVDLLGEIVGPLAAGAFFAVAPSTLLAFGAVAVLNALSFGPQLGLLAAARGCCAALREPHAAAEDEGEASPGSPGSAAGEGAWASFVKHPSGVAMLTSSYALLFFTVLSSHDVVLTAFLAQRGLHPAVLSGFRALGAAAGVLGSASFEHLAERAGSAGRIAGAYLLLQTLAVFVAAAALVTQVGGSGPGPAWLAGTPGYMMPFLGAIVVSRVGLYGFDVGFSTLSQGVVDERRRSAVGAVTEGLCAFAQLCMYAATSAATTEAGGAGFGGLVVASACSVGCALAVFGTWRSLYHEHEHYHTDGGEEGLGHGHSHEHGHGHAHEHGAEDVHKHEHTVQQLRSLQEDPEGPHAGLRKHRHIHYHGPKFLAWGG